MKLAGRTAIVTGAGPNIGQEICKVLAAEGARVACNDVDKARADAAAEGVRKAGGEALALPGDIVDPGQVQAMVGRVVQTFGGVDILVNNAAITVPKGLLNISLEAMDSRFVALSHDASAADAVASAHPLLRYRQQGRPAALFDGEPPEHLQALGQRFRPSLVDLFMALTRKPELRARQD